MRAHANAGRRWVALAAMALFVFQALIASSALASSGQGSGQAGATTIICTASGPRVVALDSEDAAQHASQQGGALPQCCTAGCAMPGGITPPALFLYSWLAPVIHHAAPAPAAAPYLQRPGAIAAAVARAACRLTPVTRTRRIPALTGAGMLPLMRRAYCPAAGVLCRRSHSESCLGTGPDVRSISGRTPSHVWRNAVHSRSGEFPCSENH